MTLNVNAADVKSALARVVSAAPEKAVDTLLAAWRDYPCAEIAEALEAIALPPDFADVISKGATEALARINRLKDVPRDPRVSSLLVSWVADPPYHATGSKTFHTAMHDELIRHSDPRAIDALKVAAKAGAKKINGTVMKAWVPERAARTAAAIAAAHAATSGVPPLPKGVATVLASAKKAAIAGAKVAPAAMTRAAGASAADDLLRAILENPEDDAVRAVYADFLSEKNDPLGEFISLQLAHGRGEPTEEQRKREMVLLRKNARRWLAELVAMVGQMTFLKVGRISRYDSDIRFERGFLSACRIRASDARLKSLFNHPNLATIDEISMRNDEIVWFLESPMLRALTALRAPPHAITKLKTDAPSLLPRLRSFATYLFAESIPDAHAAMEVAAEMPKLTDIKIEIHYKSQGRREGPLSVIRDALHSVRTLTRLTCDFVGDDLNFECTRASPKAKWTCEMRKERHEYEDEDAASIDPIEPEHAAFIESVRALL